MTMTTPQAATPMTRLNTVFGRTRDLGRAALVGCLPAGYPTIEDSIAALRTLSWHVDVLMIGLPYSTPELDGPDVYRASQIALAAGAAPATVMEIIREVSATTSVPVVLASRWEPIARIGTEAVAAAAASAGAAGAVLLDVHPAGRGAARWLTAASQHGLATTFLANQGQLPDAVANSTSWIYLPVVRPGQAAGTLDLADLRLRTRQVRQLTNVPVCAGMGISSPELAATIASGVDGVVIESAFIRALQRGAGGRVDLGQLDHRASRYAAVLREVPGSLPLAAAS